MLTIMKNLQTRFVAKFVITNVYFENTSYKSYV